MKIFVAKLNFSSTSESVQKLFENYGEVASVKVIMDRETGRSKGYGFVEMTHEDDGLMAIMELNNSEFEGREIVVKKSEPRD